MMRLSFALILCAMMGACQPQPINRYPNAPRWEQREYGRSIYLCGQTPLDADDGPYIRAAVHWGRLIGREDCLIRTDLEFVGACLKDIRTGLQDDRTPKINFNNDCDDWQGDPCQ